jgi:hypothetical protein
MYEKSTAYCRKIKQPVGHASWNDEITKKREDRKIIGQPGKE